MATLAHAATQLKPTAAGDSQSAQLSFATPKEAADALIKAASEYDAPALRQILGPDGDKIVSSADAVRDKNSATAFAFMVSYDGIVYQKDLGARFPEHRQGHGSLHPDKVWHITDDNW